MPRRQGFLYEGGIRVPAIVRWPGHAPAGKEVDTPVITTDWMPTLLGLVGAKVPDKLDGVNLTPLLTGEGAIRERALFWHIPHYTNQGSRPSGAVRLGDWKLIEHYEDGKVEVFNLKSDPGETRDLAAQDPKLTAPLRDRLTTWLKEVGAQRNELNPNFDAALHAPLYIDLDPSRYDPAKADAKELDRMRAWRKQMNAVIPKKPK